jgi:hypothetical protein
VDLHYNCIIVFMLHNHSHTGKSPKGDRLKWTPLKDVKPVPFNGDAVRGRKVDPKDLAPSKGNGGKSNLLIP